MKSKTTEEPAYGSQFIDVLKSRNTLYVAGSLTIVRLVGVRRGACERECSDIAS